jgi:hypothetical protein
MEAFFIPATAALGDIPNQCPFQNGFRHIGIVFD